MSELAPVPVAASAVGDQRQVRELIKAWRRGRATRTLRDALSDGYVALFTAGVLITMVISIILRLQRASAGCSTANCLLARELAPLMGLAVIAVITLWLARLFGPIACSQPESSFLLSTPMARDALLAGRAWGILAAAGGVGALLGGLIAMLAGGGPTVTLLWALACGLTAAALTALAAAAQTTGRSAVVPVAQALATIAVLAVLILVILTSNGVIGLPAGLGTSLLVALVISTLMALIGVAGMIITRSRLTDIERSQLTGGGELAKSLQGAMFGLDFGLMHDIVVERRWRGVGQVAATRGRGEGPSALAWRDLQRLLRNPRPLIGWAISLSVPWALAGLGAGHLAGPLSALVAMFTLIPFFTGLRVLTRTRGLNRAFPFSPGRIRDAHTVIPAILMVLWAAGATPAMRLIVLQEQQSGLMTAAGYALAVAAAGLVGAVRWVSAAAPNFQAPMLATGAGAIPPGIIGNMVRGFDVVAVVTLPLLLGRSPVWSLLVAALVWLFLRSGGLDSQEMMARSQEAQRELAEAREQAKAPKKPAPRPTPTRPLNNPPAKARAHRKHS